MAKNRTKFIKSLIEDAEHLSNFHSLYPVENNGKKNEEKNSMYAIGFRMGNDRTSLVPYAATDNSKYVQFCAHLMYNDGTGMVDNTILDIKNGSLFWDYFKEYINKHQEEIFKFISSKFKESAEAEIKIAEYELKDIQELKNKL